jgi:ABC-type nitrate/sulfonate/bicarbonate transport system substrate-binding protein
MAYETPDQTVKVYFPNGMESSSRIIADKCGSAHQKTLSIRADIEMHPDEAIRFAKQILEAYAWVVENRKEE